MEGGATFRLVTLSLSLSSAYPLISKWPSGYLNGTQRTCPASLQSRVFGLRDYIYGCCWDSLNAVSCGGTFGCLRSVERLNVVLDPTTEGKFLKMELSVALDTDVCFCGHERQFHYAKHLIHRIECQWPLLPGRLPVSWPGGIDFKCACTCAAFVFDHVTDVKVVRKRGKPCDNCGCGKGKHFDLGIMLCECGCDRYAHWDE